MKRTEVSTKKGFDIHYLGYPYIPFLIHEGHGAARRANRMLMVLKERWVYVHVYMSFFIKYSCSFVSFVDPSFCNQSEHDSFRGFDQVYCLLQHSIRGGGADNG